MQRKRGKRSSYLALRLSGEEIEKLRDAAQKAGVGPTTLARNLILQGLEEEKGLLQRVETLEQKMASLNRLVPAPSFRIPGGLGAKPPVLFVIASPDLSGRGNLRPTTEIASALSCLAMTKGVSPE